MKEFWTKYKMLIISIVFILIIVGIIYYVGKHAGKKYVPDDIIIPGDLHNPGDPKTFNPGPYTDAIHYDLSCYFCVHSPTPYSSAMKLSNSQLAAVYNDWNKRYSEKFDHQTLIQAIQSEFTILPGNPWGQATADFVARLKSIPGTQGRIQQ